MCWAGSVRPRACASLRGGRPTAVARQQADQIFNLSLTRTATRTLLTRGVKGVIGIGRVTTPTLAIVCLREIEIRDFRVEDYFEVLATAKVERCRNLQPQTEARSLRIVRCATKMADGLLCRRPADRVSVNKA
jgi:DNA topoisomerase III